MKTKHNFRAGDLIRHGERTGCVIERKLKRRRDTVTVRWDDGVEMRGLHKNLWMCERAENPKSN